MPGMWEMREEIETLNRCLNSSAMNATNHVKSEHGNTEDEEKSNELRDYLMLDDYDCIGFDLDHTLCRYNIGPMIRSDINLEDQTKFHITQISVSYLFKVRIRPVGQVSNWKAGLWWGHQGSVFWQRGGLCLQGDSNYWCTFLWRYARWTNAGADPGHRGGQSAATWQGRSHPSCQPWNQVEPHFWLSFFSAKFMFPYYLMWRKMTDVEIERQYGRYRNKHITSDYALHLEVKLFDN